VLLPARWRLISFRCLPKTFRDGHDQVWATVACDNRIAARDKRHRDVWHGDAGSLQSDTDEVVGFYHGLGDDLSRASLAF
jgi:hypothetical protein